MTYKAAVVGCTGYAGGEIARLLVGHPQIDLSVLTAGDNAGQRLGDFHSNLLPIADRRVEPTTAESLAGCDVVFLALPHGKSGELAAQLPEDVLVIDVGADHRLTSQADWQKFYGGHYCQPWVYGLPELPGQRAALANTRRIGVGGCYVATVTLSLLPALTRGLIDGRDVTVAAASGTSGAGRSPKPHLLGAEVMGAMSAYGVGGTHRHIPEMLQNMRVLGASNPSLSFTPLLAPMARGIIAVVTAPTQAKISEIRAAYTAAYADEPFCFTLPEGIWPSTQSVLGSNGFSVQATLDEPAGRLVAVGVLDNLTKGTAGSAVQSMNIALGLDESTGLSGIGVAP